VDIGVPGGLVAASAAAAIAAAARGDYGGALAAAGQLRAIADPRPFEAIGLWEWRVAEIEAFLAVNRLSAAERALDEMDAVRGRSALATRRTEAARLRTRLAATRRDPAGVAAALVQGRTWARAATPYARALLDLEQARRLPADEQPRAIALLNSAADVLRALGAAPAQESVSRELAAREAPVPLRPTSRLKLSPAQVSVARLVTAGRSNRQIAAELVVSVKTVEYHLAHIYAANGIRSRAQLAGLLVADGWPGFS
jgi:DNA-binding CsgD family transcriptional regulator